jgi:predicted HNH restriction endonuclease
MKNKVVVDDINLNFINQYNASPEELLAEAMEHFGLIYDETSLNDTNAKEHLKNLLKKKKYYHGVLPRKASFITKLGSLLVKRDIITNMQLKEALNYQKHTPIKIGEILVKLGFVDDEEIKDIIEEQKQIREVFERINDRENITVSIEYREPLFEKTLKEKREEPFVFAQNYETSDISQALIEALTTYFNNERKSNVHWKSEIVGITITLEL